MKSIHSVLGRLDGAGRIKDYQCSRCKRVWPLGTPEQELLVECPTEIHPQ